MAQPISMPWSAPVFPRLPHRWRGVQMAAFPFTPLPGAVARILPPGMEPVEGTGLVTLLRYPQTEILHPFKELVVMVPVRVDDTLGNYIPYIYVTTDEALIPGREIAGFPKKLAEVEWEREGPHFHGSATRWGKTILSVEGRIDGPLPEQAATQRQAAGAPSLNYKLIPGPAGDVAIEEITKTQLEIHPRRQEIGRATLRCEPSELDPVADLVPSGDSPMVMMLSDNTIPAGEVLKQIKRQEPA
ncbi:MAG: acetoacetate decarboxylase family protein [Myxococcota bacterium]